MAEREREHVGYAPGGLLMMWMSERQSPAAATSTSTSEPLGSGTGTSVTTGSACHSVRRTARIVALTAAARGEESRFEKKVISKTEVR